MDEPIKDISAEDGEEDPSAAVARDTPARNPLKATTRRNLLRPKTYNESE